MRPFSKLLWTLFDIGMFVVIKLTLVHVSVL